MVMVKMVIERNFCVRNLIILQTRINNGYLARKFEGGNTFAAKNNGKINAWVFIRKTSMFGLF